MGNRDYLFGVESPAADGGWLTEQDTGGDLLRGGRAHPVLHAGAVVDSGSGGRGEGAAAAAEFHRGVAGDKRAVAVDGGGQRAVAAADAATAAAAANGQPPGKGTPRPDSAAGREGAACRQA